MAAIITQETLCLTGEGYVCQGSQRIAQVKYTIGAQQSRTHIPGNNHSARFMDGRSCGDGYITILDQDASAEFEVAAREDPCFALQLEDGTSMRFLIEPLGPIPTLALTHEYPIKLRDESL